MDVICLQEVKECVLPTGLVVMVQLVEEILNSLRILAFSCHCWPGFSHPDTGLSDIQWLQVTIRTEETEITKVTLWG